MRGAHQQVVFGLEDQPGRAEQGVAGGQAQADERGEHQVGQGVVETQQVDAEHEALRGRGQQRPEVERAVPRPAVVVVCFNPEVERHAAQDQPDQHEGHRQVEAAQDHAVRFGERDQQDADAEHQPGFVRVPERPDRRDHLVFVFVARSPEQEADAEVVAVEHDVDQHRQPHQDDEDQRVDLGHDGSSWPSPSGDF